MPQTQTLNVTIKTPELRFAVMNKTHVTARSLEAAGKLNYEASAHMQSSEDPENGYELARAITSAIAETKVELGEYLNETHTTADNMIPSAVEANEGDTDSNNHPLDQVVLAFSLPSNFKSASSEALGAGIHDFIVGRAIYAWYRETVPEIADACKKDAEEVLERVKKALYKRSRPLRPYQSQ